MKICLSCQQQNEDFFLFKSLKHANFGFGYYLFSTVMELFIKPKSFIICSFSKDMGHENSYIYMSNKVLDANKETFPPHFKNYFAYN